jgi:hypothetical protein
MQLGKLVYKFNMQLKIAKSTDTYNFTKIGGYRYFATKCYRAESLNKRSVTSWMSSWTSCLIHT